MPADREALFRSASPAPSRSDALCRAAMADLEPLLPDSSIQRCGAACPVNRRGSVCNGESVAVNHPVLQTSERESQRAPAPHPARNADRPA